MLVERNVVVMCKGKVYLVGAGPGDKNLLTIEAERLIKIAEVVVYDRLVSKDILELIPETAEMIDAGKNVGNHIIPQSEINKILLEKSKLGKIVVRLKGGDPFLFGRGGEELELLIEEDIPFKVVPGITSAIAAPSYAGIPVTHREFCASVHIISGHSAKLGDLPIDYEALTRLNGTLVFLMSVASIPIIAKGLMEAGMAKDTEVAFVENGTRANQRKIITSLEKCEDDIISHRVKSPATIIIGRVCSLSEKYDWFSNQSLSGCKVLVTRPNSSIGGLGEKLGSLGAKVRKLPLIETRRIDFDLNLSDKDVIVFTSAVGVEEFFNKLKELNMDARVLYGKKIAVVGAQTAKSLEEHGIRADFCPSIYSGEALGREMLEKSFLKVDDKVGIYRAQEGSLELMEVLRSKNIKFDDIPVYETKSIKVHLGEMDFDYITFTSASIVKSFADSVGEDFDFSKIKGICIGEQTAKVAKKLGIRTFISEEATIDSVVERVEKLWKLDQED
ncbi:MAG: uroporphyrinogen-III C-methyltransferase [Filifactoraceae bacterium]